MSTKLTRLLKRHVPIDDTVDDVPAGHIICNWTDCGFKVVQDEQDHWRDEFAEHVTAVLIAEGFGDTRETEALTLEKEAASFQEQSETYLATSQAMVGSPDSNRDDIIRYGAYASAAQSAGLRLTRRAKAIRSGE